MTNHKTITTNVTYVNQLPQNKINFIQQQELLYKACMHVLRSEGIEVSEKHEQLFDAIPDHDAVDLLDTIETLYGLITNNEQYSNEKVLSEIVEYVKPRIIAVESLDVLERNLAVSELDQAMYFDSYTGDTLEELVNEVYECTDIECANDIEISNNDPECYDIAFYYAELDNKYVAVFI